MKIKTAPILTAVFCFTAVTPLIFAVCEDCISHCISIGSTENITPCHPTTERPRTYQPIYCDKVYCTDFSSNPISCGDTCAESGNDGRTCTSAEAENGIKCVYNSYCTPSFGNAADSVGAVCQENWFDSATSTPNVPFSRKTGDECP